MKMKYSEPLCPPMPVQLGPPESERKSVTAITLEKMREEWTAPLRAENARLRAFIEDVVIGGAYEDEGDLVERAREVLEKSEVPR